MFLRLKVKIPLRQHVLSAQGPGEGAQAGAGEVLAGDPTVSRLSSVFVEFVYSMNVKPK